MKKRKIAVGTTAVLLVMIGSGCRLAFWDGWFTSPYVAALPSSATEVQVFRDDLGIDWAFCLKARMPETDYQAYLEAFPELEPHSEDRVYGDDILWLDWMFVCENQPWWDATDALQATYVRQVGDAWTLVKYENGYLYVNSHSH